MHGDGGTLYLNVAPGGSKSWVQRVSIDGKRHDIGLGGFPVVSLAMARPRVGSANVSALSFAGVGPTALCRPHSTPAQPLLPHFGRLRLGAIHQTWVLARFDAGTQTKPRAANRTFEILRSMIFRAEEWGLRESNSNPCLGGRKNRSNSVARFLDTDGLTRSGHALAARRDPMARSRRYEPVAGPYRVPA